MSKWSQMRRHCSGGPPPVPACPVVSGLVASRNVDTSAEVAWASSFSPTKWYVSFETEVAPGVWVIQWDDNTIPGAARYADSDWGPGVGDNTRVTVKAGGSESGCAGVVLGPFLWP